MRIRVRGAPRLAARGRPGAARRARHVDRGRAGCGDGRAAGRCVGSDRRLGSAGAHRQRGPLPPAAGPGGRSGAARRAPGLRARAHHADGPPPGRAGARHRHGGERAPRGGRRRDGGRGEPGARRAGHGERDRAGGHRRANRGEPGWRARAGPGRAPLAARPRRRAADRATGGADVDGQRRRPLGQRPRLLRHPGSAGWRAALEQRQSPEHGAAWRAAGLVHRGRRHRPAPHPRSDHRTGRGDPRAAFGTVRRPDAGRDRGGHARGRGRASILVPP